MNKKLSPIALLLGAALILPACAAETDEDNADPQGETDEKEETTGTSQEAMSVTCATLVSQYHGDGPDNWYVVHNKCSHPVNVRIDTIAYPDSACHSVPGHGDRTFYVFGIGGIAVRARGVKPC